MVFISCCGLSLILLGKRESNQNAKKINLLRSSCKKNQIYFKIYHLAAFLWRKYTRTPNCDTSILDQNQQVHTKKFQPFLDYSIVHHVLTL